MPRPPKITNEEILAAARQVFLEQGEGGSTVEIAEKAGISEASIFKRFATKQALFLAAIGVSETPQYAKILSNQTPTAEIRSELTEICTQMVDFYQEMMPRVLMMMTQSKSALPPMVPPPIRDSQLIARYIDRAISQGHLKPCDSMTIAHAIVGSIQNYSVTRAVSNKIPFPIPLILPKLKSIEPQTFVDNLIETLWTGIAPD
ncbi:TetR/AcrR family transcriptional regulator [Chamaesiphon polymorphus]|uniref:TetR/AcrR family transcriptional regulator n=1 Tax=Chamaesiphon polymorphus CCALA 037 TaxID=2107692 RepID=A0A2T1FYU9_9CYAN|nr:TetR/AcrR family transcriptional regulator [Chamaesiphon polymorphus]PSB50169.1 TetR/AcrR family transcriptional regulator [Chamaesiphon polymorphus CCALA 037]